MSEMLVSENVGDMYIALNILIKSVTMSEKFTSYNLTSEILPSEHFDVGFQAER